MNRQETPAAAVADVTPIFISVKQAATILSLSRWSVDQLLDAGTIESQWHSNRRLVRLASVHAYADSLPTEKPKTATA